MLGILLVSLLPGPLPAQPPPVSRIHISGHKITKEYVIRREIQHPVGIPLDSSLAEEDRDRIENLGIFATVIWREVPLEDRTVELHYQVVESALRTVRGALPWYDEKTGWSLKGGVMVYNFRGRNENLNFGGSIGAETNFGLDFLDPWIAGDHLSLELNTGRTISEHIFLPFKVAVKSFELNLGRYFGYQRKFKLGFELEEKAFYSETETRSYLYLAPRTTFMYDTRDLYLDPSRGVLFIQNLISQVDLTGKGRHTTFWYQSWSLYRSLRPGKRTLVLGLNLSARLTGGSLQEVWQEYIGGGYTVRGWRIPSRKIYRDPKRSFRFGQHWVVASGELRQTLIPRFATRWETEFGLYLVPFLEAGLAHPELEGFFDQAPMLGTGLGFHFLVPIFGILRLDYGWSFREGKYQEQSFHFSIGPRF